MRDFAGRTCVVTGAASGIGRAVALALAGRGARLAVSDLDEDGVEATAHACVTRGAVARSYPVDVADRAAVDAHAARVVEDLGPPGLVVNNAGVSLVASIEEMSYEDLHWVMDVNFWGVVHGSQAFLPHLVATAAEGRDAHLVNVSSIFGLLAAPKQSAYCASKFAVLGFTESLRQDLVAAGSTVGVSSVHPGGVRTAILEHARLARSEDEGQIASIFRRLTVTSADSAAAQILRGVQRNRARILVGYDALGLQLLPRVLGSRYERLNILLMRRLGI